MARKPCFSFYSEVVLPYKTSEVLPYKVTYGHNGMIKEHPRTGITHNLTYLFTLFLSVTMHLAQPAGSLVLLKRTGVNVGIGILQKPFAGRTKLLVALFVTAVEAYHDLNSASLFFNATCLVSFEEKHLRLKS